MIETLLQSLLALLAPELGQRNETRAFATSTSSATRDLGEFRHRIVAIQSDVSVALALAPSGESAGTASLTADQGGVRLAAGTIVLHLVTRRAASLAHVGSATGTIWIAPVSRKLPEWLGRLLG